MPAPDHMRDSVEKALAGLAPGRPLREGAAALLGALGYRSERVEDVGSVPEFLDRFDAGARLTEARRALFDSWRSVEIVFQVTDEEVGEVRARQDGLFREPGFDRGRAKSFLFLAVELDDRPCGRTELAEATRAVNRLFAMPAILLFRRAAALTLAVVHRRAHRRDDGRDVLERVTLIKDVRAADPHRAHVDVLADLALPRLIEAGVRDFDGLHAAWERTLDIEALNRRFYRELFEWFRRAAAECRFPDDGAGEGSTERHVIRLITRLLFVWFMKEKGLIPEELFEEGFARRALKGHAPERTDYYRAALQNLFFATLNTGIGERAFSGRNPGGHRDFARYRYRGLLADPDGFVEMLRSVPFVNGGLFDCLDDFEGVGEGGRRIDAFTDVEAQGRGLSVPARLFLDEGEGLFPLFRRYKFTVEENTPLDREVALDPELLGRAFENLLAAYNPETRETARKATGSYYTPRRIVDYMVGEALAAALAGKARPADGDADWWRDRLGYLLDWEDACDDAATLFDAGETDSLVRAIAGLRVLDPAAGSGAFPMGVLHRLTLALRRLDPRNERWEALQKELAAERAGRAFDTRDEAARNAELVEISRIFETYRDSDFGRKLYLIQNGIYGVDVQPIACQIAKLRFFVSLVVEQEANDDPADNHGIRPLPNLETRFVAADALIGLGVEEAQGTFGNDAVKVMEDRLRDVRERYFNARARETKRRLRGEDEKLRVGLARELESLGFGHDAAEAVARWDPYDQNARAGWFDPEYMFGAPGGFDVVIGNPPYIRGEKIAGKARLAAAFGAFHRGAADIYTYFFRKGADLLADGGTLCFIASNKFMRADYGRPLREFLKRDAPPLVVLDFGRTGAFDATVRPLVLLARKGGGHDGFRAATVRGADGAADPGAFMDESGFPMKVADLPDSGWTLAAPELLDLRARIEAAGTPLRDHVKDGPYRGIVTGLNPAFVVDADTRERLIDQDPASEELIRPWLRGRDVRRWRADWRGLYVVFTRRGTDIGNYPAIERHLSRWRPDLEPRPRHGAKRGRKPGGYEWFEIQDNIAYHEAFARPKIVYPDIGTEMRALLDREGRLTGNTCYIIPGDDACLLALLNSRLLDFWFRLAMPCLDDPFDGGDMRFFGADMERAPIATPPAKTKRRLTALANRIQTAKEADPNANAAPLEREIDEIVYRLYGLDERDAGVIKEAAAARRPRSLTNAGL